MATIIPTPTELALIAAMRQTYASQGCADTATSNEESAPATTEKAKAKPKPEPEKPAAPTIDDVRAVLKRMIKSPNHGEDAVEKLLKKFGADELPEVDADDYPKLIAKAEGMLEG
jgi:hypothetical protein